jgi:hypothetical protein
MSGTNALLIVVGIIAIWSGFRLFSYEVKERLRR